MENNNNTYLFQVPKVESVMGRIDFVLNRCKGKKVLHLGCVDEGLTEQRIKSGELLHFKLIDVAEEVIGVDISKKGIKILQECGVKNIVYADIEKIDEIKELRGHSFDIILLTEVLEHLNNPGLFLEGAKKLFDCNSIMIITVPNGLRLTGLMRQIKGYEFVHPDHNYWFSYMTIKTLMKNNGYGIKEMLVYSLFDTKLKIRTVIKNKLSTFYKRIKYDRKLFRNIENVKKNQEEHHLIKSACTFFLKTLELIFRKYINKRNPFLAADGIILIVKPVIDGN